LQLFLHQTHHTIADFDGVFEYVKNLYKEEASNGSQGYQDELHLFPELFLTGYPLQDLCLQKPFIVAYENLIDEINNWSLSLTNSVKNLLIGGLHYKTNNERIPTAIYRL